MRRLGGFLFVFLTPTAEILCPDIRSHRSLPLEGMTYTNRKILCNKNDGLVNITNIDKRLLSVVKPPVDE